MTPIKPMICIKQSPPLLWVILTCFSLTGCSLLSATIPVDEAQIFVDAAFKEVMAEVEEVKLRPSKVTFAFYADEDVNALIKQRQQPASHANLLPQTSTPQTDTRTQLIKYNLQCELSGTVTFFNCQTAALTSQVLADNISQLNFKRIQLRKNNRLNIIIQSSVGSILSAPSVNEYNLQCYRKSPETYQDCRYLPDTSKTSIRSEPPPFSIEQVTIHINKKQFEVSVSQSPLNPPQQALQTLTRQSSGKSVDRYIDPKPISFKVLMLRDNSLLLSADQESLNTNLQETLGKNYIDHNDYVLTPGEFKFIGFTRVDDDTRYVGIIADYRDSTHAAWKKVFKIEPTGSKYPLFIHLKRNEVDILTEE